MTRRKSTLIFFSILLISVALRPPVEARSFKTKQLASNEEFRLVKEGGKCDEYFVQRTASQVASHFRQSRQYFGIDARTSFYTIHLVSEKRFKELFQIAQAKSYRARLLPIRGPYGFVAIAFAHDFYSTQLHNDNDWSKLWSLQIHDLHRHRTGREMKETEFTVAVQNIKHRMRMHTVSVSELLTSLAKQ